MQDPKRTHAASPAQGAHVRRDTPLSQRLADDIRTNGPISVEAYVTQCLWDPAYGYYATHKPIGAHGDFTTAPEISQVFGELIGLWSAVVWQQMGQPAPFTLMELGPGRGTLMNDALRATQRVDGFHSAASIALIEASPALTALQRETLASWHPAIDWRTSLIAKRDNAPRDLPTIILANEFLDCLPFAQAVACQSTWQYRGVGLDHGNRLAFCGLDKRPVDMPAALTRAGSASSDVTDGAIAERSDYSAVIDALRDASDDGALATAALFIDYGSIDGSVCGWRLGDSLQAVRNHQPEHPLTSPGQADLTMHVDFKTFAEDVQRAGFLVDGPTTQAEFLGALGLIQRASTLMSANPQKAAQIEAAVMRLMAPSGMGTRFKVIGVRSADVPPLPGFTYQGSPCADRR